MNHNPCGIRGIAFVHYASPQPEALTKLFVELGFSRTKQLASAPVELFEQGRIRSLTYFIADDPT